MTIQEALKSSGIDRLEAEVLLADLFRKDRSWLTAHSDESLPASDAPLWAERVERRKRHEPVAYITGKAEFYGEVFAVTDATLIPRSATESLVDLVIDFLKSRKEEVRDADTGIVAVSKTFGDMSGINTIVDVGTGSGCIAITIKRLLPDLTVVATDVSSDALVIAKNNAKEHQVDVQFLRGNLLEPVENFTEPFLVVSNPPYIPSARKLTPDVFKYEPHAALFSGKDGNNAIRALLEQCKNNQYCKGITLECEKEQLIEVRNC